jgi:hypothetical protein
MVALIGLGFGLCVTIQGWLKVNLLVNLLEGPPSPHVVEGVRRPRVAEGREQSFPSAHCKNPNFFLLIQHQTLIYTYLYFVFILICRAEITTSDILNKIGSIDSNFCLKPKTQDNPQ